jgi:hypothetical protein
MLTRKGYLMGYFYLGKSFRECFKPGKCVTLEFTCTNLSNKPCYLTFNRIIVLYREWEFIDLNMKIYF